MAINIHLPQKSELLRPTITVVGVGGAGGNAVNNMINASLEGVSFVVANTDAQALENSLTDRRIQLGSSLTRGLGAGASPEVGRAAAEEAMDEIAGHIEGSNMVFITAGMGGGTGTGAAPVVARLAKERGILTVGVVTKPFQFEGAHRMRLAEQGLRDLQQYVDTLIVIPNQNLFRIANEKTTFSDAFRLADEVLHSGVRGVTDLMIMPGLINLDFADIRTVMREMGKAMMGTGEAEGPKRAVEAAEAAISNPLLDDVSMKGARGVLINITGGYDMTLFEADEAATRIREEVDPDANIIFGATFNASLEGKIRVSVVATGIDLGASIAESKPSSAVVHEMHRNFSAKSGFASRPTEVARSTPLPVKENSLNVPKPAVQVPLFGEHRPYNPAKEHAVKEQQKEQAVLTQPTPQGPRNPTPKTVVHAATAEAGPRPGASSTFFNEPQPLAFAYKMHTCIGATSFQVEEAPRMPMVAGGGSRAPMFISPAASQPQQRTLITTPQETLASAARESVRMPSKRAAQHSPEYAASQERAPQHSQGSMSFFQRVANVGKALSSRADAPDKHLQVVEKPKVEVTERTNKIGADDTYLEIPAFLRRQAN